MYLHRFFTNFFFCPWGINILLGWDGGEGEEVFVSIVLREIASSEQKRKTKMSVYIIPGKVLAILMSSS